MSESTPERRRLWPWLLLALSIVLLLVILAGASLISEGLAEALNGIDIRLDGKRVLDFRIDPDSAWVAAVALLVGLLLLLALLLVIVPLAALLILLGCAAMAAVAFSPLWLIALLLWLILRKAPARVKEA